MGGPLYLVNRESYSNMLNWQQAAFESVKQGGHEDNYKLHGKVRPDITQAGTPDTHTHRQHTATYQTDEASRLKKY